MAERGSEFKYTSIELLKTQHLGSGSYGGVYKAKCDGLLCASKIVHPTLFDPNDPGSSSYLSNFWKECQLLSRVRHPNVVQYLGVCYDPSTRLPVLLMELCNENLSMFLERSPGPLSYSIQVNICHDIALALVYLHSNGLIHRDLTGNNVLIIAGPRAKITDFGMSKLISANPRMSALTLCPGNMLYMAPEALDDTKRYTTKLDIFSVGVIIIQIITREFPNPAKRLRQVFAPGFNEPLMQVVPETQRRKNHIKLIPDFHPLKPVALHCMGQKENQRSSALELSERLCGLKQNSQSVKMAEKKSGGGDVQELEQQVVEQGISTETKAKETRQYQATGAEQTTVNTLQKKVKRKLTISKRSHSEEESNRAVVGQNVAAQTTEREHLQEQLKDSEKLVCHLQQQLEQSYLQRAVPVEEEREVQPQRKSTRLELETSKAIQKTSSLGHAATTVRVGSRFELGTSKATPNTSQQGRGTTTGKVGNRGELGTSKATPNTSQQGCGTTTGKVGNRCELGTSKATPNTSQQGRAGAATTVVEMRWTEGGRAPERMCRGSVVVHGDTAYFRPASSQKVFSYQSSLESWSLLPDNPHESFSLAFVDGSLTSVGGWDKTFTGSLLSLIEGGGDGEEEGEGRWVMIYPPMPTPRRSTTCFTIDKSLIGVGGYGVGGDLATVELMNTETKTWSTCCPLPQKSSQLSGTLHANTLYLAGGYHLDSPSKSVFACSVRYLQSSHSLGSKLQRRFSRTRSTIWREILSLPVAHSTLVSFHGELLAIGGKIEPQTPTNSIYRYNYLRDVWEFVGRAGGRERYWCFAVSLPLEQLLMVIGGCTKDSIIIDNVDICQAE